MGWQNDDSWQLRMTADHPISDCRIMSVTMLVLTVLLAAFVWCVKKSLSGSSCYIFLARRTKPWRPAYTLARVANTVCSCTAELIAVHLCAGLRDRFGPVRHIRNRLHFSFNTDREKHERLDGGLAHRVASQYLYCIPSSALCQPEGIADKHSFQLCAQPVPECPRDQWRRSASRLMARRRAEKNGSH